MTTLLKILFLTFASINAALAAPSSVNAEHHAFATKICKLAASYKGPTAMLIDGNGNPSKGPVTLPSLKVDRGFIGEGIETDSGYFVLASSIMRPENIATTGFAVNLKKTSVGCKNANLFSVVLVQNYKGNGLRPYNIDEVFPNMLADDLGVDTSHAYKFDARLITVLTN